MTDGHENPLVSFGKDNRQNFPLLSLLAKTYLSVATSSVPVVFADSRNATSTPIYPHDLVHNS